MPAVKSEEWGQRQTIGADQCLRDQLLGQRATPNDQGELGRAVGRAGVAALRCAVIRGTLPFCVEVRQSVTVLWARPESLPPLKVAR